MSTVIEGTRAQDSTLETKAINAIRILSAESVQSAKSGHPGMPMGMAGNTTPPTRAGRIGTALCFPPATVPCCFMPCCI